MSLKTIAIDPQLLKMSSKKRQKSTKVLPTQLNINSNNIRQMLIDKLRKSRKTQKLPPKINTNSFDNHSNPSYLEPKLSTGDFDQPSLQPLSLPVNTNKFPETIVVETIKPTIIQPDKPYGVLKNGTKPTYKTWNLSQKNYDSLNQPEINQVKEEVKEVIEKVVNPIIAESIKTEEIKIDEEPIKMIQEREIKKTYTIGKNKKARSVGVLIKNINTRKRIEDDILKHKKTNITTVKNYLKSHNMIKHGTTAPTNLLRTMYENMKLCGDVANDNINNLMHNFEKD
jgi:hypothetical protein